MVFKFTNMNDNLVSQLIADFKLYSNLLAKNPDSKFRLLITTVEDSYIFKLDDDLSITMLTDALMVCKGSSVIYIPFKYMTYISFYES